MSKLDLTEQHTRERARFVARMPIALSPDDTRDRADYPCALRPRIRNRGRDHHKCAGAHLFCGVLRVSMNKALVMRTRARHIGCSAAVLVAVTFAAAIAAAQLADAQALTDRFVLAPQRLTPAATSGTTFGSSARRGTKGWIALHRPDGEFVYIKVDQIVFVMNAKDTGAAERARSLLQLLNGQSNVRESVEEVMRAIENDGALTKDASVGNTVFGSCANVMDD